MEIRLQLRTARNERTRPLHHPQHPLLPSHAPPAGTASERSSSGRHRRGRRRRETRERRSCGSHSFFPRAPPAYPSGRHGRCARGGSGLACVVPEHGSLPVTCVLQRSRSTAGPGLHACVTRTGVRPGAAGEAVRHSPGELRRGTPDSRARRPLQVSCSNSRPCDGGSCQFQPSNGVLPSRPFWAKRPDSCAIPPGRSDMK